MRVQFENKEGIMSYCREANGQGWRNPYAPLIKSWYYADSSEMNRKIVNVNIIVPDKVVEVTFLDGDKQKAVCQEPDEFSLEQAISICITKHLLGGTGAYNKAVKNGIKVYEENQRAEWREKTEEERIAKRRAKKAAYMKRRAEKRREEQIEIQKEAYVRALKEVKAASN